MYTVDDLPAVGARVRVWPAEHIIRGATGVVEWVLANKHVSVAGVRFDAGVELEVRTCDLLTIDESAAVVEERRQKCI